MDEQILQELIRKLSPTPRPANPMSQLFRDLAFLTADIPVDSAGQDVTGPFPDFRAANTRQNRVFNPRAISGFESLAQLFQGAAPLSSEQRRDQPADATAVARARLDERLASHALIDELSRPKSLREEFAGRESELGTTEETSHLAALIGGAGAAKGIGSAVARRGAARVAKREAGQIFQEAERQALSSITRQAQERTARMGSRVTQDPIAELRRLLGPQGPQ